MTRQIANGYAALPTAALEGRIAAVQESVRALAGAVDALARGLEGSPVGDPEAADVARAARLARELLLAAGLVPSPHC